MDWCAMGSLAGHAAARQALARMSTAAAGNAALREATRRGCEHGGENVVDLAVHGRAGDISNGRSGHSDASHFYGSVYDALHRLFEKHKAAAGYPDHSLVFEDRKPSKATSKKTDSILF